MYRPTGVHLQGEHYERTKQEVCGEYHRRGTQEN